MELGLSLGLGAAAVMVEDTEECSGDPPVQLDLLPREPVHRLQCSSSLALCWHPDNVRNIEASTRGFDVNCMPSTETDNEAAPPPPSPNNSSGSPLPLDRAWSRASDEDDNNLSRKKLRLSKDQSAFLEESFKEHNTLNPKQKLALAKQLNLRPRQVEVWFQNRRARTKLKQTEVDCEYLKRCCETLTEENRRLHKELTELRALKATAAHPLLSHLPATTLSMCPSCERVSSSSSSTAAGKPGSTAAPFSSAFLSRPRFFPFAPHPSAAS
ncbi:homeobox-leucine zipper protein [Dioscorea alata]|uniref:Homeobox-leucine zipper protein n=1 Tax=Dioscorea alata TaxID=55571 RepID=A0ACB7U7C1_DIOAL|nr:homeobox-leucine zipper protein [Dioscorea alata]